MNRSDPTHVQEVVKFGTETDKALQITTPDGELLWIPFSQVDSITREPDGTGAVEMSLWIAQQKGLV